MQNHIPFFAWSAILIYIINKSVNCFDAILVNSLYMFREWWEFHDIRARKTLKISLSILWHSRIFSYSKYFNEFAWALKIKYSRNGQKWKTFLASSTLLYLKDSAVTWLSYNWHLHFGIIQIIFLIKTLKQLQLKKHVAIFSII